MDELITKALVFDYFSGKVSPIQKKSIESWLAKPDSREKYYQWLHEWETANLQLSMNWQMAFLATQQRVQVADQRNQYTTLRPVRWWSFRETGYWLAAASILCVLGLGVWLSADHIRYKTVKTGFGETKQYTLPDGSLVDLNANSSIRFPRFGFETGNVLGLTGAAGRRVELTGEADFSVRHLSDHQQFIVLTKKGLAVNVLGTQFTVLSRERRTRVVLRSGKVTLTLSNSHNQPPLVMKPGDQVTLDADGKLALRQLTHPENSVVWKQHRFSFEKTSLREIAVILQENYGLNVTIDDSELANRTISGSFPAQDANEVIKIVAELLQINYIRDNNTVTFTN